MPKRDGPGSGKSGSSGGSGGGALMPSPAGSALRDSKLPLPDDFFRAPQLNAKETKYLVNLAKRACKEVVYYSRRTGGPMSWVHLSSDDGVEVFQGMDDTASDTTMRSITYLRGSTRIYATIDEVADFFKLDTPMKLSGFTQTVGKDLLDQKTLYDLAMPTAENPKHYVGVKWTAVESPSKLARNRDFCYLECHDEFIDTNTKKRGWVRSLHSIRLPFCPPLTKSHGLVRGSLYRSGFVFIESDDKSYVDAVHTLHMDIKGNAPNWLKIMVMKRRIKNIAEVNRYFQMRRLCEGGRLLGDLELPSKSSVTKCQICRHKFGLFSRKSTCRKCGKVVCNACGHHFILDYAGVGAKKVKVCTQCSDTVSHGSSGDAGGLNGGRPVSHLNAHRVDSVDTPLYDHSPTSANGKRALKDRQRSIEEQNYYRKNEDDRGLADIEEAKRMHREFEDQMSRSRVGGRLPMETAAAAKPPVSNRAPSSTQRHRAPPPQMESYGDDQHQDDGDFINSKRDAFPQPAKKTQEMSAYQEFIQQERARQTGRMGATTGPQVPPPIMPPRGGPARTLRNSMLRNQEPLAPGDALSRARQNHGFDAAPMHPLHVLQSQPLPQELLDSVRISSEWDNDYVSQLHAHRRLHANGSFFSDETVGAPIRRSDLSIASMDRTSSADRLNQSFMEKDTFPEEISYPGMGHASLSLPPSSVSSSHSSSETYSNDMHPPGYHQRTSRVPHNATGRDFHAFQRSYFDARNSDITELEQRIQSQPTTDDEGDFRYGYDDTSAPSEDADFAGQEEYEVPVPTISTAAINAASSQVSHRSRRKTVTEAAPKKRDASEELATVMALSAMRLYEKENGSDLQVSEETRQAALKKMVEIYTNEIEQRSSGEEKFHQKARQTERSVREHAPGSVGSRGSDRPRAQTLMGTQPVQEQDSFMEYRNLSDLSASAFRAYQKGELNDAGSSQPRSDAEPSLPSTAAGASHRVASGPESKTSSRRNARLGLDTDDGRSRGEGTGTTNGSLPDSESRRKPPSRPNSIRDDVSDTFSELDLIDLPHLMRADEAASNSDKNMDRLSQESQQTTFSEVSEWQERNSASLSQLQQDAATEFVEGTVPNDANPYTVDHEWPTSMSHSYSVGPAPRTDPSVVPHNNVAASAIVKASDVDTFRHGNLQAPLSPHSLDRGRHSAMSDDDDGDLDDYNEGDLTSRSKMTLTELERYRASLAELMAEYNQEHNRSVGPKSKAAPRQPEREREPDVQHRLARAAPSPNAQPNMEHVLQELYL